jgi:hypothetical protein
MVTGFRCIDQRRRRRWASHDQTQDVSKSRAIRCCAVLQSRVIRCRAHVHQPRSRETVQSPKRRDHEDNVGFA